jgi:excisionase family DNA binding protein
LTQLEPEANTPGDLLPIDTAADALGTSRSTVYRLIRAGEVRSYRRRGDRKTYVSRAALERALSFKPDD